MSAAYLEKLFADCGSVELRCLPTAERQPVMSGIFDDPERLRRAALWAHGAGLDPFVSLNKPRVGITAHNNLDSGRKCLANADIAQVVRLPFDLDPCRPTGNSTDDEVEMARDRALALAGYLRSWNWPEPLMACSGNGAHLQYRAKLPADERTAEAMATLYKGLARRFSDDAVRFDEVVRNPARIFRLYGHMNRKCPATPDRPQRMATAYCPTRWDNVPHSRFWKLAERLKAELDEHTTEAKRTERRPGGRASLPLRSGGWIDLERLDVVRLFRQAGLYTGPLGNGMHGVRCPWAGEHTGASPLSGSDTCIWEASANRTGRAAFHCKHSHCGDRKLIDVARLLGGQP